MDRSRLTRTLPASSSLLSAHSSARLGALLCVLALGCPSTSGTRPGGTTARGDQTPTTTRDRPLSEPMRQAFGAAARFIPADASFYSASYQTGKQWQALVESRAIGRLMSLPTVQAAVRAIAAQIPLDRLDQAIASNPRLATALAIGKDALSTEVFVYADARLTSLLGAWWDVYVAQLGGRLAGHDSPLSQPAVEAILEHQDQLRMPGIVIGFALSQPEVARTWLADVMEPFASTHSQQPVRAQKISGGQYYTLQLKGSMISRQALARIGDMLHSQGQPDFLVHRFLAFVGSQTLDISIGLRENYLLLSLGANTDHLRALGSGPSLVESAALAPARAHYKDGLTSLLYASEDLSFSGRIDRDDSVEWLWDNLATVPSRIVSTELKQRLVTDVTRLIDEINAQLPAPTPLVSVTFDNNGSETFSVRAGHAMTDDPSGPLTILRHAGPAPLLALASHGKRSTQLYDMLARWGGIVMDYIDAIAVPQMDGPARARYLRFHDIFISTMQEFDATNRELFLPSIDGIQRLFTVDGGGRFQSLPGGGRLPEALRVPRPALVLQVADVDRFKQAFASYRNIVNRLIKRTAQGPAGSLSLPAPATRPFAGGTLYYYDLPISLGNGIEPHVLIKDNLVIFSLFPAHSETLVATSSWPNDLIVAFDQPSGSAYQVDLRGLFALIVEDIAIALRTGAWADEIPSNVLAQLVRDLPVLGAVLGTHRRASGRSYLDGPYQVSHSHVDVQDLAE